MKIKKQNFKKEIFRLNRSLSKNLNHVNMNVFWNKKRKDNVININNVSLLKEKKLHLIGIVYFTNKYLMGQMMLLIDEFGKEISYTTYFNKEKSIEISYCWKRGICLMAMFTNDYFKQQNY